MTTMKRLPALLGILGLAALLASVPADAQEVRIGDLTSMERDVPVRLVGYGLVVGLDGTGDRTAGGFSGGHTIQSVVNLLRRFDINVPPGVLRTRNVAAVLVTAEVSPYLRAGGDFEVQVSSVGDAVSLRGGVLWMTPLVAEVGGPAVATAQGAVMMSDGTTIQGGYPVETSGRIPSGGLLERALPRPGFQSVQRLLLRNPDLGTATRIAEAVNRELGDGAASVEDPGSVLVSPPDGAGDGAAARLSRIAELRVEPRREAMLIIDGRDGTVVAGGELPVGEAAVSHGGITVTVGGPAPAEEPGGRGEEPVPGSLTLPAGTSAQEIAAALHAVAAPPTAIASIFESLREVGALASRVRIR
jgi:flagellar P-ring protein precursor FlgI